MKFDDLLDSVLAENLSRMDLKTVEAFADDVFKRLDIEVEFTKHFLDRVNDDRNGKDISVYELVQLFKQAKKDYGKTIALKEPGYQAVLNDLTSDINLPFVLKIDSRTGELEMIAKTVMRKKSFKTSNDKLKFKSK